MVFDRGYARVELIKDLNRGQQPFLIRAPHKAIIQAKVRGPRQRLSLWRLPHTTNWRARKTDIDTLYKMGYQRRSYQSLPAPSENRDEAASDSIT